MKKNILISIIILLFFSCTFKDTRRFTGRMPYKYPLYVYSSAKYHFYYVPSGFLGDVPDLKVFRRNEPLSSKKTMILKYKDSGRSKAKGWVGFYWQYPANNWGENKKGGFDFSRARYLYFYARGKDGGELINFKIGGDSTGKYGNTADISSGTIKLTKYWKIYKIDLREYEMHNIVSGFGVFFSRKLNGDGVTIYLNDIYFTDKMVPEKNKFWEFVHNKFNRILMKLEN